MERTIRIFFVIVFLFGCTCFLQAQSSAERRKQQELETIENRKKETQRQFDKYKRQKDKISREVSSVKRKKQRTKSLSKKVDRDKIATQKNLKTTKRQKAILNISRQVVKKSYTQVLEDYYFNQKVKGKSYTSKNLGTQIFWEYELKAEGHFLAALYKEDENADNKISSYIKKGKTLDRKKQELKRTSKSLDATYTKKVSALKITTTKYNQAKQELNRLEASARDIKRILGNLESKRTGRKSDKAKVKPPILTNSLPWPINGRVISKFGKEYNKRLQTWIYRDGIKIQSSGAAPIKSVASGSVIYAGQFRSYGNVIIVEHGKGFFTIYGFLSKISVKKGHGVATGTILGYTGKDTQGKTMGSGKKALYFEIRFGVDAQDPLKWLRRK